MKKSIPTLTAFAIVILFFIQLAGTLVESIYILDLMNLKLDEKALGLFFFFAPVLFFPFFKKHAKPLAWAMCALLLITRGWLPYLHTSERLLAAGLGVVAAQTLLFLLLTRRHGAANASQVALWGAAGFGLALMLSILLRTWGNGIELSLIPAGGWLGWGLAIGLIPAVIWMDWDSSNAAQTSETGSTGAILGVILLLTLTWFSFSAPAVIARWTEGSYTLIVSVVSLLAAAGTWVCIARPGWLDRVSPELLLAWNMLFTLSLTITLLAQRVAFPPTPGSAPVVVTSPGFFERLMLGIMLLSFPVLLLDMRLFIQRIARAYTGPRDLVPGFLLGILVLVLLVFANIFSNVWGYVPPISLVFRGTFWLSYFLLAGGITLIAWQVRGRGTEINPSIATNPGLGWGLFLGLLVLGTILRAMPAARGQVDAADRNSLIVMTYNIQDATDQEAEKSFERQLANMRKVSPDIISLQESDTARISVNNNDYARYYAEQLGYDSYYGPRTVTGTYGTAILSKFPLENSRTFFTYSDTDEIGTTETEIVVNGRRFTIYDVHPAGSETAKIAFAQALLERSKAKSNVIALGDYNMRDDEPAYQLIDSVYKNAWTSVYPSKISPEGVDMSGRNRIDHIFVSPALGVRNPMYVLPPGSGTDHPLHWAEIFWESP